MTQAKPRVVYLRRRLERFADYNLPGPELPKAVVRAFYEFWCAWSRASRTNVPLAAMRSAMPALQQP